MPHPAARSASVLPVLTRRLGQLSHRVLAGIGAFALITACSAKVVPVETSTVAQQVGPTVDEPTAEQVCALVPLTVVNETVPVPFAEAEPGVGAIAECRYRTEFDQNSSAPRPSITLSASLLTGAPQDTALDDSFRDENDEVVEYQRLTGLGDDAGYGPYTRTPDSTLLAALLSIDHGYWTIEIQVEHPEAGSVTVDQLRALAVHVLNVLPS